MDRVRFLGTGGGRWCSIYQTRSTAGFRLELGSTKIHVDPGPGTISRYKELKLNPRQNNCLIVSHCHLDHYSDAEVLIEAMGMAKVGGTLLANKNVLEGTGNFQTPINAYHRSLLTEVRQMADGDTHKVGKVEIEAVKLSHSEPETVGFIFNLGTKIGYIADTEYFPELSSRFKGLDLLICNLLRPGKFRIQGHMCTDDAIRLLRECKPARCIITHFGLKMIRANPALEAQRIADATGIGCMAAEDGMPLDVSRQSSLDQFR